MRKGYELIVEKAKKLNSEAGIPAPIRHTCVKPGGTVPKLAGRTPGIGHPTFDYTLRTTRIQQGTLFHTLLAEAGIPFHEDHDSDNTDVFEYPILQGPGKPATEVSLWEQANNLVLVQREWADNAVSNTLYFKPKWVLTWVDKGEQILIDYLGLYELNQIKRKHLQEYLVPEKYKFTIVWSDVCPECLGKGTYEPEPEIGNIIFCDQCHCSGKIDPYVAEVKLFEYDPKHEEDDVEAVLSSIVPLIKSVSLIPHTPKGVYRDMPEQGITKEEYEQRLSEIKQINWADLSGSDGMDDKYCSGDTCERIH